MHKLISTLLFYIQIQQKIIVYLTGSLIGKHISRKVYDEPVNKPYRKLQIDKMPVIEIPQKLNYKQLIIDYQNAKGKPLKPVKPHKSSKVTIPTPLLAQGAEHPITTFMTTLVVEDSSSARFVVACLISKIITRRLLFLSAHTASGIFPKSKSVKTFISSSALMTNVIFINIILTPCLKMRDSDLKKILMNSRFDTSTDSLILTLSL